MKEQRTQKKINLNALLGWRAINVKDKTQAMNFARNISMLKGSSGGPHGHCQMDRDSGEVALGARHVGGLQVMVGGDPRGSPAEDS